MKWLGSRKREEKSREEEYLAEVPESESYDEYINYGILHIEKKVDAFMNEEIDVSQCLLDVQKEFASAYEQVGTINEMIEQVNSHFKQFEVFVGQIDHRMEKSDVAIQKADTQMDELTHQIEGTCSALDGMTTTFQMLEKDFSHIQEMSKSITGIAGSTNLLALNASIEASRAGEAGKGFSVVATHIRELSASTKELASGIDKSIKTLYGSLDALKKEIINSKGAIAGNLKHAENVQQQFKEVSACSLEVKEVSKQIVSEIERANVEINHATEGVSVITGTINEFGDKLDILNTKMSKKAIIICGIIDFLQQLENMLKESLKKDA